MVLVLSFGRHLVIQAKNGSWHVIIHLNSACVPALTHFSMHGRAVVLHLRMQLTAGGAGPGGVGVGVGVGVGMGVGAL
ncbi:hypothetical protein AQUCO_04900018v1 [Aquilegia coerulea]|uniref:Uncharacterized protein n=1 Tax=Aquilegia coerulea TaxID=218851 RepID=A0A2G5CJG6_AQUCA|nr:hypothetical protein AQUCO_04900018v1 [Aquilegia coerulea]PIA31429.1 hypothetical protein AQUCO_04900018v1 [Aquilegia coerulea]